MSDNTNIRNKLLALQQELLSYKQTGREAANTVELDQSRVGRLSRMDALQGQAMSQALNQRREIELRKIDSALQRLASGDYGDCIKCGEAIALQRLALDPAAALCIGCAERRERCD